MNVSRTFVLFWIGQGVSMLGDAFAFVALPLLVFDATGSVGRMGGVSATAVIAQIIGGLVAGALTDRIDRRRLMIACDVGRAVVFAALPLWWLFAAHALWIVYAVAIVNGVLTNLFSVSYVTAIAELVPSTQLNLANARLQGTQALAYVIGPMLAGAVVGGFGATKALFVDAASFVVSVAMLGSIRFGAPRASADRGDALAGIRFLLGHPLLRSSVLLLGAVGLASSVGIGAGIIDVIIFRLRHDMHQDDRAVGLVLGLSAVGAMVGAVFTPLLRRRAGFGACFVGGTLVQAAGLFLVGRWATVPAAAGGAVLWAAGLIVRSIPMVSLRQEVTPLPLLGRVTAASWTFTFGASAVGTVLVTRAGAYWGTSDVLTGVAVALGAIGVAGLFGPVRSG